MAHELEDDVAGDAPQRQGDAVVVTEGVRRRPGGQHDASPSCEASNQAVKSLGRQRTAVCTHEQRVGRPSRQSARAFLGSHPLCQPLVDGIDRSTGERDVSGLVTLGTPNPPDGPLGGPVELADGRPADLLGPGASAGQETDQGHLGVRHNVGGRLDGHRRAQAPVISHANRLPDPDGRRHLRSRRRERVVEWPEPDLAFVATALLTGLRLSELLSLDLGSLDGREGERRLQVTGKGHKVRFVPVKAPLEVTPATWYRWLNQYGGMKSDDAKKLKELEKENQRLKKIVADQARSSQRKAPAVPDDEEQRLRAWLRAFSAKHPRWGWRGPPPAPARQAGGSTASAYSASGGPRA